MLCYFTMGILWGQSLNCREHDALRTDFSVTVCDTRSTKVCRMQKLIEYANINVYKNKREKVKFKIRKKSKAIVNLVFIFIYLNVWNYTL